MSTMASSSESVSGTAYLTALYRALESEREDALFHDPYARLLAGKEGARIEQEWPYVEQEAGSVAVRTKRYDEMLLKLLENETVDAVLNLGAGLDTRPYRLSLPASLRWIEVDLPGILAYKEKRLAKRAPVCQVERVGLDLRDQDAREELFARLNREAKNVLVISEGLLGYLRPEQVSALAHDLNDQASFRWWMLEFLPAYVIMGDQGSARGHHAYNGEKIQFAPEDGLRFFEVRGWKLIKYYSLLGSLRRLKRDLRFGWFLRLLNFLSYLTSDDRKSYRHAGGYILLERDVATGETRKKSKFGWLGTIFVLPSLRRKKRRA